MIKITYGFYLTAALFERQNKNCNKAITFGIACQILNRRFCLIQIFSLNCAPQMHYQSSIACQ
jgi:hypothetical protein